MRNKAALIKIDDVAGITLGELKIEHGDRGEVNFRTITITDQFGPCVYIKITGDSDCLQNITDEQYEAESRALFCEEDENNWDA